MRFELAFGSLDEELKEYDPRQIVRILSHNLPIPFYRVIDQAVP